MANKCNLPERCDIHEWLSRLVQGIVTNFVHAGWILGHQTIENEIRRLDKNGK